MIRVVQPAVLLAFLLFPLSSIGSAATAQAEACLTLKHGVAREIGRLKSDGRETFYCVYARAGQTMKVTIRPLAHDLITQGRVVSPISHQGDGGPGGVIFDHQLSEDGRYEIHVGQRLERRSGTFELSVELRDDGGRL